MLTTAHGRLYHVLSQRNEVAYIATQRVADVLFFAVASRVIPAAGLVSGLTRLGSVLAAVTMLPLSLDAPRAGSLGAFLSLLMCRSFLAQWCNDAKATDTVLTPAATIPGI